MKLNKTNQKYKSFLNMASKNSVVMASFLNEILLEDNPELFLLALKDLLKEIDGHNDSMPNKCNEIIEDLSEKLKKMGLCLSIQII